MVTSRCRDPLVPSVNCTLLHACALGLGHDSFALQRTVPFVVAHVPAATHFVDENVLIGAGQDPASLFNIVVNRQHSGVLPPQPACDSHACGTAARVQALAVVHMPGCVQQTVGDSHGAMSTVLHWTLLAGFAGGGGSQPESTCESGPGPVTHARAADDSPADSQERAGEKINFAPTYGHCSRLSAIPRERLVGRAPGRHSELRDAFETLDAGSGERLGGGARHSPC